jgi:hypothetical protein
MRDEMYAIGLETNNGIVKVPTAPGLGVEPDRAAMARFCVQTTEKNHVKKNASHAAQRAARPVAKIN